MPEAEKEFTRKMRAYTEDVDNQSLLNYGYDAIGNLVRDDAENIQEIKWNAYGKISSITRTGNNDKSNLEFGYDASGQRLWKTVKPRINGVQTTQNKWTTTWYIRDASGNPIATYNENYKEQAGSGGNTEFVDEIMLIEQAIFAANRIGVIAPKKVIAQVTKTMIATGGLYDVQGKARLGAVTSSTSATVNTTRMDFYLGRKNYELSNHLGNVLAVVSDRKQMIDDGTYVNGLKAISVLDNISDYYQAEYQSFGMYYAFGAPLTGRGYVKLNSPMYRYGFNGQEKDDEVAGEGNSNTAEYWQYDTRLGRRFNVDPRPNPSLSIYACFGNNPIFFRDINGDTAEVNGSKKQKREFKKILQNRTGDKYKYQGNLLILKKRGNRQTTQKKSGRLAELVESSINSLDRISFNLTYDPSNVINYDIHLSGEIDLKDLKNTKGSKIYQAAILGHIFEERLNTPNYRNKQTRDPNFNSAHQCALIVESQIVCEMSGVDFAMISNPEDVNWSRNWDSQYDISGNRTKNEIVTSFSTYRVFGNIQIKITVGTIWRDGQTAPDKNNILKVETIRL